MLDCSSWVGPMTRQGPLPMTDKILIIDDDVDTLKLVGLMLERQGYQITVANNGQQGLTKANSEQPDLILLDVMMPDMDGYEVTQLLRRDPEPRPHSHHHVHRQVHGGRQSRRVRSRR